MGESPESAAVGIFDPVTTNVSDLTVSSGALADDPAGVPCAASWGHTPTPTIDDSTIELKAVRSREGEHAWAFILSGITLPTG